MTTSTHRLNKQELFYKRITSLYDALLTASPPLAIAVMKRLSDASALAILKMEFRRNSALHGADAIREYWSNQPDIFGAGRLDWLLDGTFDEVDIANHAANEIDSC